MRLIDADAFDKCLSGAEIEATKSRKYVFSSAINTIRGNLANFPTVNQWIPCSERMPEFGEDVLITLSMGHLFKGEIVIAYLMYDNCNKLFWLDYVHSEPYETDEVLAWMPLPEDYEESEEKE